MGVVPVLPPVATGFYSSSSVSAIVAAVQFSLNHPAAELRQTVAQSIPATTWTPLTFTTEDLDSDGGHDNAVNPSRYTAVYAGWYLLGGGYVPVIVGAGQRGTRWAVNGTSVNASDIFLPAVAASECHPPARSKRVFLGVGDYVELQVWQNSGGPLNTAVVGESASSMSVAWDRSA